MPVLRDGCHSAVWNRFPVSSCRNRVTLFSPPCIHKSVSTQSLQGRAHQVFPSAVVIGQGRFPAQPNYYWNRSYLQHPPLSADVFHFWCWRFILAHHESEISHKLPSILTGIRQVFNNVILFHHVSMFFGSTQLAAIHRSRRWLWLRVWICHQGELFIHAWLSRFCLVLCLLLSLPLLLSSGSAGWMRARCGTVISLSPRAEALKVPQWWRRQRWSPRFEFLGNYADFFLMYYFLYFYPRKS